MRPDPDALSRAAATSIIRAAICIARGELERPARPSEIARTHFADDRGLDFIMKAAVSPTSLANAPALATIGQAFLDVLRPVSAGADLLGRGIGLSFDGAASITVPGIALPTASFVAEGAPIPVVTAPVSPGPVLAPHKLAVITTLSGELLRSSNAETLVRQALAESVGPALELHLAERGRRDPGPSGRPARWHRGVDAVRVDGKSSRLGRRFAGARDCDRSRRRQRRYRDCAPAQAIALALRIPSELAWPILTSASLAAGTVICVAASAVVSAIDGPPLIDASQHAELHRDTTPGEITTAAGTIAYPVGSLFQTDEVGLRLRWPVAWGLRSPTGIAWMSGVSW